MQQKLIPEGYFEARAVRVKTDSGEEVWAQWGRASTGTQQVLITFEITDEGDWKGVRLPWFGYFTDASWERTVESLTHCGFQGDDLSALNSQQLDQPVSVKIEHEQSQSDGRLYARVGFVNARGGGGVKLKNPMSANDVRGFAASMKGKIAALRAGGGQRSTNSGGGYGGSGYGGGNQPPPPTDDDLPF